MTNNAVNYKKSKRKQVTYGLVFSGIVVFVGMLFSPINTLNKILVFAAISLIFAALAIFLIRKAAKEAVCPHCDADIFEVIQASE